MAKYRVLETSYINEELVYPGTIVDFDGIASPHLELVDKSQATAIEEANIKALRDELKTRFSVTAPADADLAELRRRIQAECMRDDLAGFVDWPQPEEPFPTEKSAKAQTAAQLEAQAASRQAPGAKLAA